MTARAARLAAAGFALSFSGVLGLVLCLPAFRPRELDRGAVAGLVIASVSVLAGTAVAG